MLRRVSRRVRSLVRSVTGSYYFRTTLYFVLAIYAVFPSLGLGTTQLYNVRTVLNQKRHGEFKLGGRNYFFHRRLNVPSVLSKEVLLVELFNNLKKLAEDPDAVLESFKSKVKTFDQKRLLDAASKYGTYSTNRQLTEMMSATNG